MSEAPVELRVCEPEVDQARVPFRVDQHVVALDITVNDAGLVKRIDRAEQLVHDHRGTSERQPPFACNALDKPLAENALHHEIWHACGGLPVVDDAHQVPVLDDPARVALVDEAPLRVRVLERLAVGNLDSHCRSVARRRLVDRTHPARSQPPPERVTPDGTTCIDRNMALRGAHLDNLEQAPCRRNLAS
ncbi:MAG TPA: hypothetical protein VK427_02035 [Kofleriaceae bacterium]|nr:hypothetical protein [Kofleriaceae bacterium]